MHLKNMPQKRSVKTNLKKGKLFQSEIKLLRKDVKPGPEYDDEILVEIMLELISHINMAIFP